jgi:hypothetical protein
MVRVTSATDRSRRDHGADPQTPRSAVGCRLGALRRRHRHNSDAPLAVPIMLPGGSQMVSCHEFFNADEAAQLFDTYYKLQVRRHTTALRFAAGGGLHHERHDHRPARWSSTQGRVMPGRCRGRSPIGRPGRRLTARGSPRPRRESRGRHDGALFGSVARGDCAQLAADSCPGSVPIFTANPPSCAISNWNPPRKTGT